MPRRTKLQPLSLQQTPEIMHTTGETAQQESSFFLFFFPQIPLVGAQTVQNPPALQETRVRSLGQEDPLEEGVATHSSILAWRIPWTEEPGGLQSTGSQRVGHD